MLQIETCNEALLTVNSQLSLKQNSNVFRAKNKTNVKLIDKKSVVVSTGYLLQKLPIKTI